MMVGYAFHVRLFHSLLFAGFHRRFLNVPEIRLRIERQLAEYWKNLDCTVPEDIDELGAIHSTIVTLKEVSCQKIPEPSRVAKALLDAMQVRLPEVIEARHVEVVTRKKISESRKK